MTTLLLFVLIIYFGLKCVALKHQIDKSKQTLDKFQTIHLDLVTNDGTKLKIDKTSDDDLSLEFVTRDGQTIKFPN